MQITREFSILLEERLKSFTPLIQIIVGPRQVGKSTAIKNILSKYPEKSVYIQFDSPGSNPEETIRFNWNRARAIKGHKIIVFDEIQNVANWVPIIKSLYDEDRPLGELSVALLGSSSLDLMLQSEESLLGRFEIIRAPHWNYSETQKAFSWSLHEFLQFGGYPIIGELLKDQKEQTLARCQSFVRDSIIEPAISRDILSLRNVLNTALFRQALQITLSIPCEEISFNKLLGQLSEKGSVTTLKSYLELMEKAFLIKLLYRYSGGQIRMRSSSPKIVPLASALIHSFVSPLKVMQEPAWFGYLFEAAIISKFNELGYELFYWSNSKVDVDFIAKKNENIYAFEVKSHSTPDWRGLKAFQKEYPNSKIAFIDRTLGEEILANKDSFLHTFLSNL